MVENVTVLSFLLILVSSYTHMSFLTIDFFVFVFVFLQA